MIASAIGGHVPNSYAVVTLFGVDGLLLIMTMFQHKSIVRSSYIIILMFIICYRRPCQKFICSGDTFKRRWVTVDYDDVST